MRQAAGSIVLVLAVLVAPLLAGDLPAAKTASQDEVGGRYAPSAPKTERQKIGRLGDCDRLVIEGTKTFTEKQLKDALFAEFDVYVAGRASESLDAYMAVLRDKLQRGYKNTGFPWARIELKPSTDGGKLIAKIDEGPRFLAGDVLVDGAKTLSVTKLIERLTKPHAPKDAVIAGFAQHSGKQEPMWHSKEGKAVELENAVWQLDKPASFHAKFENPVKEALADLGYHFAAFSVSVMPNSDTKKADLVINITSEGSQSVTDDVQISGNKKNTREEILKYLDIKPGKLLDREELTRISSLLWRSGRFIKYEVKPVAPEKADDKGRLCIDLIELKTASPLSKPLSAEEQILLKTHDWICDPRNWEGDMWMRQSDPDWESHVIFSPRQGMLLYAKHQSAKRPAMEYAAQFSHREIGGYDLKKNAKFVLPLALRKLNGSIKLTLSEDPAAKKPHFFGFAVSFSEDDTASPSSFAISIQSTPSFFIDYAHVGDAKYSTNNDVLTITGPTSTVRVDTRTGRLIELALADDTSSEAVIAKNTTENSVSEKNVTRIGFTKGEFQRLASEVLKNTTSSQNVYDPKYPATSAAQCFCKADYFWSTGKLGKASALKNRQLIQHLAEQKAFAPLDQVLVDLFHQAGEKAFTIPSDTEGLMALLRTVATWVWQASRSTFPPDSGPDLTMRVMLLSLSGQQQAATADWRQLLSSGEYGPFSRAMAEQLMKYNPVWQFTAQYQSPKPLTAAETRNELAVLLNQDYPIGKFTRSLLLAVRELKIDDIQTLSELLPECKATAFCQWAKKWQSNRTLTVEDGAYELITQVWQPVIARIQTNDKYQATVATSEHPKTAPSNSKPISSDGRIPLPTPQPTTSANLVNRIDMNSNFVNKHIARGEEHLCRQEYDKAIDVFNAALRLAPNSAMSYWRRAAAFAGKGEWEKALADDSMALRLAPETADFWLARAEVCLKMSQYDWAIADCTEALRIDSRNVQAYQLRAKTYQQKADADLAKAQQLEKKKASQTTRADVTDSSNTSPFSMSGNSPFKKPSR